MSGITENPSKDEFSPPQVDFLKSRAPLGPTVFKTPPHRLPLMRPFLLILALPLLALSSASAQNHAFNAFFKSSNSDPNDQFGSAVAISGNIAAVGAPFEDGASIGIDGPDNNDLHNIGAVFLFARNGLAWTGTSYLKPSLIPDGLFLNSPKQFGTSLAFSGNTLVVGAPGDPSPNGGVNANEDATGAPFSGAVYVFVFENDTWTQQAYIKTPVPGADDRFGERVALDGDTLVVGAPFEDSSATTVDGPDNDDAPDAGAAYVYERIGTTWSFSGYLKPSNGEAGDEFGSAVAVSGDRILVGSPKEDGAAGAAYLFERNGATWDQKPILKAPNTGPDDRFGAAVAIHGDVAFVGAPFEDGNSEGLDGPDNDAGLNNGAVYGFVRVGDDWNDGVYLKAPNSGAFHTFGSALAITAGQLVVAAQGETSNATEVDGDMNNDDAFSSGAAYLYTLSAETPGFVHYFKASNTTIQNMFGQSVAVSDRTVIVGTGRDDAPSRGINADQTQDADPNEDSGAAYVFHRAIPARPVLSGSSRFPATPVRRRSRPRLLEVANAGEADLTGITARATGRAKRDFRITGPDSRTIESGDTTTLRAYFRPTAKGPRRAILTLGSNAAPLKRSLIGRGR